MSKTSISSFVAGLLIKPSAVNTTLSTIDRIASWSGIEPRFFQYAAGSMSGITGLPRVDCEGLTIAIALYALFRISCAVWALFVQ
jgi:hypothetical protein